MHHNEELLNPCNACDKSRDKISVIIFIDDDKFAKTGTSNNICARFSMILDLPPLIRNSFQNIITNFLINSKKVDVIKFMEKNMHSFAKELKNGIVIENNEIINVKLVVVIADAPAMAKKRQYESIQWIFWLCALSSSRRTPRELFENSFSIFKNQKASTQLRLSSTSLSSSSS